MSTQNKKIVITGAVSGIGGEIAKLLAGQNYDLILINRTRAKTEPLLDEISEKFPNVTVSIYEADLSDQEQLKAAAAQVIQDHPQIDGLIHNAGVLLSEFQPSKQGHHMEYEVNVLAPVLLTQLLKPALIAGSSADDRAKIIYVSSGSIMMVKALDIQTLSKPEKVGLFSSYPQTKLAGTIVFAHQETAFAKDGIEVYTIDPGGNKTNMTASQNVPLFMRIMFKIFPFVMKDPSVGAGFIAAPFMAGFKDNASTLFLGGKWKIKLPDHVADETVFSSLKQIIKKDLNI